MKIVLSSIMTRSGHSFQWAQKIHSAFLLLIISFNVDATYDIDDATLYRVNFVGDGTEKSDGSDGLAKDEDKIKLYAESSAYTTKVLKPGPGEGEPPTVIIPDHSDMTLKRTDQPDSENESHTVTMLSSLGEKYFCTIPQIPSTNNQNDGGKDGYEGRTALDLLEPLFLSQSCAYRLEHYWTYELCHGRFLRQYHEEREGKKVKLDEYFLGRYSKDAYEADKKALKEATILGKVKKPQRKRVETMNMPYYELIMKDGTTCDLNGLPRMVRVQYVCYPSGKHEMYSFKETSTCEYEVMVLSPLLCSHPDYRPESANEQNINCKPANKVTAPKPQDLVRDEAESLRLLTKHKMYEADFFQGTKGPGSIKIEIKPVNPFDSNKAKDVTEKVDLHKEKDDARWKEQKREPVKPLTDPQVVRDFLMGDHCLYGGSGWWKYEFCYGKLVNQYHEEKGERLQIINLGNFDKGKHIQWLKENPSKLPKPAEFRKHVSHFYSDGDFCELVNKPRQIEVKLKCKPSQSISAVSLYLLEPKKCEYILGVESPLVCDILNRADEFGLMEVRPDDFDDSKTIIVTDDETLDDLVEKAGKIESGNLVPEKEMGHLETVLKADEVVKKHESVINEKQMERGNVNTEHKHQKNSEGQVNDKLNIHNKPVTKESLLKDINDLQDLARIKYDKKTNKLIDTGQLSKEKIAAILAKAKSDILSEHKNSNKHNIDGVGKDFDDYDEDTDPADSLPNSSVDELAVDYDDDDDEDTIGN